MEAVKIVEPVIIYESGTANGYATGWMAEGLKAIGKNEAIIHTCDPRADELYYNVDFSACQINYYPAVSAEWLKHRQDIAEEVDFVFLDGDHSEESVCQELTLLLDVWRARLPVVFIHYARPGKGPHDAILRYINGNSHFIQEDRQIFWKISPGSLATNMDGRCLENVLSMMAKIGKEMWAEVII